MLTPFEADEKPAIPSSTIFSGHPASRDLFFREIAGTEGLPDSLRLLQAGMMSALRTFSWRTIMSRLLCSPGRKRSAACSTTPCQLLLVGILFLLTAPVAEAQQANPTKKSQVSLVIDFGDHFQKRFTAITWTRDMTILDVLQAAAKHPRGIGFKHRGKGKTAFLTSIDKLENQGGDRNWVYRVNGKLGDRSFATFKVQPTDAILWTFGKYR